ncbi:MAG: hypothetical protein ACP5FH_05115 [Terracidiphilus sp.]
MPVILPFHASSRPRTLAGTVLAVLSILAWTLLLPGAQAMAKQAAFTAGSKPAHRHKHPAAARGKSAAAGAVSQAPPPAAPSVPLWPANENPAPAAVVWDSHGLRIDAANSSLKQILKDVTAATGTKIEGFGTDQRIFGNYGPGSTREVLSQLLQGSGYNILMIGNQDQGAPLQVILTPSPNGPAPPAVPSPPPSKEDLGAEAEPEPQPLVRSGFGAARVLHNPPGMMQGMRGHPPSGPGQPPPQPPSGNPQD